MAIPPLPLEGIRILSQGIVWAGPFATLILADLGAEVIEVESIHHLNPTRTNFRHLPPPVLEGPTGAHYARRDASEGFWNRHAFFNYGKRGCKSITLDLTRQEGRALFLDLVRISDVFLENNAADVVERLDLDYPQLSEVNPRLIMVRFPGFGISGPYRDYKGFAAQMEAIIGHTALRGYRDADHTETPGIYHGDPNAGAHVAFAIQAALYARDLTGEGQLIELAQAEAVIHHTAYALMDYSMNRRVHEHQGNRHPSMAPYGVFPCAGHDRWLALAVPSDEAFAALCNEMGQPQLASDPRFADVVSRHRHQDDLEPLVSAWTLRHEQRDLMQRLQAAGVPAVIVARQEEMDGDPHLEARDFWLPLTHPDAGAHRYPGPMARFSETPLRPARPAPCLGEHNEEILRGLLGVDEARYRRLVADNIIGTAYLETAT